ncbi:uncharacterized protein K452DRAFT_313390 [Aplosporella prunicola CBS 121167]|uniref:Uncharacterized protein n=1 Tax=Aplosporella prunicola CBS 121167 TaxID=1176127 RepID=A0A6A6AYY6_9PEZI|nr:uncharacterized protein K452DRAFT_313390 [Aplosporella prunicola CBS 121167]KAF2136185.1 hypothetical protein K452DRAFT_313390 [Aplosporella prunicola CBS 121167]
MNNATIAPSGPSTTFIVGPPNNYRVPSPYETHQDDHTSSLRKNRPCIREALRCVLGCTFSTRLKSIGQFTNPYKHENFLRDIEIELPKKPYESNGIIYQKPMKMLTRAKFDYCLEGEEAFLFISARVLRGLEFPDNFITYFDHPKNPPVDICNGDGTKVMIFGTFEAQWWGNDAERAEKKIFINEAVAIKSRFYIISEAAVFDVTVCAKTIWNNKLNARNSGFFATGQGGKRKSLPYAPEGDQKQRNAQLKKEREEHRQFQIQYEKQMRDKRQKEKESSRRATH